MKDNLILAWWEIGYKGDLTKLNTQTKDEVIKRTAALNGYAQSLETKKPTNTEILLKVKQNLFVEWVKLRKENKKDNDYLCYCGHKYTCDCSHPNLELFITNFDNGNINVNDKNNGWKQQNS